MYRVDAAAVEYQIGSTATQACTLTQVPNGSSKWGMFSGKIVCPTTVISSGEKIRLIVTSTATGAGTTLRIYHDPKGYDINSTILSTDLINIIPFRIDL